MWTKFEAFYNNSAIAECCQFNWFSLSFEGKSPSWTTLAAPVRHAVSHYQIPQQQATVTNNTTTSTNHCVHHVLHFIIMSYIYTVQWLHCANQSLTLTVLILYVQYLQLWKFALFIFYITFTLGLCNIPQFEPLYNCIHSTVYRLIYTPCIHNMYIDIDIIST